VVSCAFGDKTMMRELIRGSKGELGCMTQIHVKSYDFSNNTFVVEMDEKYIAEEVRMDALLHAYLWSHSGQSFTADNGSAEFKCIFLPDDYGHYWKK